MLEDAVSNNFAKMCPLPKGDIILNSLSLKIDVCYKPPSVSRFCGIRMSPLCTVGSVRRFLFSRPSFSFIFGDEQNSFQIQTARYDWPSEVEGLIPRPCLFSLREEQDTLGALCPCDYLSNLY